MSTVNAGYFSFDLRQGDPDQVSPIATAGLNPVQMHGVIASDFTGLQVAFVTDQFAQGYRNNVADALAFMGAGNVLFLAQETGSDPFLNPLKGRGLDATDVNFAPAAGALMSGPGGTLDNASLDIASGPALAAHRGFEIDDAQDKEVAFLLTGHNQATGLVVLEGVGNGYLIDSGLSIPTALKDNFYGGGALPASTDAAMAALTANAIAYAAHLQGLPDMNFNDAANTISGTSADNDIFAAGGNDSVSAGGGNDIVHAGAGDDTANGDAGSDIVWGDDGKDTLSGGGGDDQVWGGADDDTVNGNGGRDFLVGGSGNDRLSGGGDADIVFGGSGNDRLNGGDGNDVLIGGLGNDVLTGGAGDDVFKFDDGLFPPSGAVTMIGDFEPGHDKIDIYEWRGPFHFVSHFDGHDHEIVIGNTAAGNRVQVDQDGDGNVDCTILVNTVDGSHGLGAGDFILY